MSSVGRTIISRAKSLPAELDEQGQSGLLARDRHRVARNAGLAAEPHHLFDGALDQEPVAEVLDERAIRIAARDVGEEEDAARIEKGPGVLDQIGRVLIRKVVEQTAGQDEVELQPVL